MSEAQDEIVAIFFDEVEAFLTTLSEGLLRLEVDHKAGKTDAEQVNLVFRALHSIKGASGMLGFDRINKLTHKTEALLDGVRSSQFQLSSEVIQGLFEAIDALNILLNELKLGEVSLDIEPILFHLDELILTSKTSSAGAQSSGALSGMFEGHSDAVEREQQKNLEIENDSRTQREHASNRAESDLTESSVRRADRQKYLGAFLDEANDCISSFETDVLKLDENVKAGADASELVAQLFRYAHQLKASAAAMGYKKLSELMHVQEAVLDRLRMKTLAISTDLVGGLLSGLDVSKICLDAIKSGGETELDISPVTKVLRPFLGEKEVKKSAAALELSLTADEQGKINEALKKGLTVYEITVRVADSDPMPGMRALIAGERIAQMGELLKSVPPMEELLDDNQLTLAKFVLATSQQAPKIQEGLVLDQIASVRLQPLGKQEIVVQVKAPQVKDGGSEAKAATQQVQTVQTMRVEVDRLDELMNLAGELVVQKARFAQVAKDLKEVLSTKQVTAKIEFLEQTLKEMSAGQPAVLRGDHLQDNKLNLLSEEFFKLRDGLLKLDRAQVIYQNYQESVHQLDLVLNRFEKSVMDIRMVPVGPMFGRFKRVVRDVSKELGKEVALILLGEDTEVDKKLIDELGDPLTHLVRNAVDHGLEKTEQRIAVGKPAEGSVTLNAYQKGSRIQITVKDDGKGLDPQFLRRKAVEKGLMTEQAANALTDREAIFLICAPGFSTAQSVTNISGRGVGMDIVKKKIEELSGSLEIQSRVGEGTTFIISLPLTLATQKCLMSEIHDGIYAVPIESVTEIVQMDPGEIHYVQGQPFARVRDRVIPILRLNEVFPHSCFPEDKLNDLDLVTLVILSSEDSRAALRVHKLIGEENIVIKALNKNFQDVQGLSGVSILGTGKLSLILDVSSLFEQVAQPDTEQHVESLQQKKSTHDEKDDSQNDQGAAA